MGDNIALIIEDESSGRKALYAPGLGVIDDLVWDAMQSALYNSKDIDSYQ